MTTATRHSAHVDLNSQRGHRAPRVTDDAKRFLRSGPRNALEQAAAPLEALALSRDWLRHGLGDGTGSVNSHKKMPDGNRWNRMRGTN